MHPAQSPRYRRSPAFHQTHHPTNTASTAATPAPRKIAAGPFASRSRPSCANTASHPPHDTGSITTKVANPASPRHRQPLRPVLHAHLHEFVQRIHPETP